VRSSPELSGRRASFPAEATKPLSRGWLAPLLREDSLTVTAVKRDSVSNLNCFVGAGLDCPLTQKLVLGIHSFTSYVDLHSKGLGLSPLAENGTRNAL